MSLNGFLAHTSVQWHISNNHEEMLTNSLTSMKNAVEQGIALLYFHILSCVFIYLFERGIVVCICDFQMYLHE